HRRTADLSLALRHGSIQSVGMTPRRGSSLRGPAPTRPLLREAAGPSPDAEPLHRALGLTDEEFALVVDKLGREPNPTELAMFAAMWSEHCSYKSSKVHLRTLPTEGEQILVGPGQDAGVVDLGDGVACVFKMESHSHP